jgi:hypothetical protein
MNQNPNNYKLVKIEELQNIFRKLENSNDKNFCKNKKDVSKNSNQLIKLPNIDYNNSSNKYKEKIKNNNINLNDFSM